MYRERLHDFVVMFVAELEVEISAPPNVIAGDQVVLTCRLSTGGGAPDVTWR